MSDQVGTSRAAEEHTITWENEIGVSPHKHTYAGEAHPSTQHVPSKRSISGINFVRRGWAR